ncbi:hypothetical protein F4778DRAFT_702071 [Xylariomycetidae sp. FL2044]|nr:hypothetical protein F4778DRAFT_702071 [Xylariomycetidae sp. FL2044]
MKRYIRRIPPLPPSILECIAQKTYATVVALRSYGSRNRCPPFSPGWGKQEEGKITRRRRSAILVFMVSLGWGLPVLCVMGASYRWNIDVLTARSYKIDSATAICHILNLPASAKFSNRAKRKNLFHQPDCTYTSCSVVCAHGFTHRELLIFSYS